MSLFKIHISMALQKLSRKRSGNTRMQLGKIKRKMKSGKTNVTNKIRKQLLRRVILKSVQRHPEASGGVRKASGGVQLLTRAVP